MVDPQCRSDDRFPYRLVGHPQGAGHVAPDISLIANLHLLSDGGAQVSYHCLTAKGSVRIPPPKPPAAADDLWRTTCCELFVGCDDVPAYREFNFSPSGEWAIYDFVAYRKRNSHAGMVQSGAMPAIVFSETSEAWTLTATLPAVLLQGFTGKEGRELRFSLTCVLEANDGELSYWALAHPQAKPDFHDRGGFILHASAVDRVAPLE